MIIQQLEPEQQPTESRNTGPWLVDNQPRDLNNELWLVVYLIRSLAGKDGIIKLWSYSLTLITTIDLSTTNLGADNLCLRAVCWYQVNTANYQCIFITIPEYGSEFRIVDSTISRVGRVAQIFTIWFLFSTNLQYTEIVIRTILWWGQRQAAWLMWTSRTGVDPGF